MLGFLKKLMGAGILIGAAVAYLYTKHGDVQSTAHAVGIIFAAIGALTFFFAEHIGGIALPTTTGVAKASPAVVFRILGVVELLVGGACLIWG